MMGGRDGGDGGERDDQPRAGAAGADPARSGPAGDLDPAGEGLWRAVLEAWTDPDCHDRFVGHCYATTRLVAAAARYRTRLDRDPDDEIGRRMSTRVASLAAQSLRPTGQPRPPLSRSPFFLVVIALAAVAGALLGLRYGTGR